MADENWASREWDTIVLATRACKIVAHDALQGFIARPVSATTLIAATVLVNNLTPCSLRWLPSIASLGVLGSIVYGVCTVVPAYASAETTSYASAATTGLQASAATTAPSETFIEKASNAASEYTACCNGTCCDDFNDDDTCSSSGEDSGGQSGEDCDRASDEERRE
jgi:hypothetical protein